MSLLSTRTKEMSKMLLESGEYEVRKIERNVGGIYYTVFGKPFYFGGEIQEFDEIFPTNPKFIEFEMLMKPQKINEELAKKALLSIGINIQQP